MHEEDEEMNRLRQQESVGGAPRVNVGVDFGTNPPTMFCPVDVEPNESWPMVIYIGENGSVVARREMACDKASQKFGSTKLAHKSAVVLRVLPHVEPGDSDGGQEFSIEVLKFRHGNPKELFESTVEAYLSEAGRERDLLDEMKTDE